MLYTCPMCYAMDCFGICFTHAQTCDNVRFQSATRWAASVHALRMPNVLRNGLLRCACPMCYAMDCFGECFTHAQTCDNVRVQSATQWAASVHALHMPNVLRNGLLRYMLYTCPMCCAMDCFGICFTHAQTCDNFPVQSATQWNATPETFLEGRKMQSYSCEMDQVVTLPETNVAPKMDGWNISFRLGWPIFRNYLSISFRECT